jgi:hypothetical protein
VENNYGGTVTVTDSIITGNTAGTGGGVSNRFRSTLTAMNSIISNSRRPVKASIRQAFPLVFS